MTPDDAMLMAYADGELDAITAKRIERAIAGDPALALRVEEHRALRAQLAAAFPLGDTPDPLETVIRTAPVPLTPRLVPARLPIWRKPWSQAGAMAACLVIGLFVGGNLRTDSVATDGSGALVASGALAQALDTQLEATDGKTRMLVTFRDAQGRYCRVFSGSVDGIACRDDGKWRLVRTAGGSRAPGTDYRQAGSGSMALMADAQALMAGDPLDADAERKAQQSGWKPQ